MLSYGFSIPSYKQANEKLHMKYRLVDAPVSVVELPAFVVLGFPLTAANWPNSSLSCEYAPILRCDSGRSAIFAKAVNTEVGTTFATSCNTDTAAVGLKFARRSRAASKLLGSAWIAWIAASTPAKRMPLDHLSKQKKKKKLFFRCLRLLFSPKFNFD